MKFVGKYKEQIIFWSALFALAILLLIFKIPCPIRYFTGISCPGCGITRAFLSAIRLDFGEAFHYHPLWITVIPLIAVLPVLNKMGKTVAYNTVLYTALFVIIAVWVYRVFLTDSDVVGVSLEDGIIAKAIEKIKLVFK